MSASVKILIFILTSFVFALILAKLDTGPALFTARYFLFAIPIAAAFVTFWMWLFRKPRE